MRKYSYSIRIFLKIAILITIIFIIRINFNYTSDIGNLNTPLNDKIDLNLNLNLNTNRENKALKSQIHDLNSNELIINSHYLNRTLNNNTLIVILIQIHKRIEYLTQLIESFKHVDGINRTLIIFSHDYYDDDMNNLIKTINFCAYTQIFYPYSIQIYVDKFPGTDINDCPPRIGKSNALKMKCLNAAYADTYGNYRDANYVQIKHHWSWKLSHVFDKMRISNIYSNLNVLLVEEDYYLMPDTLFVLNKLIEKKESKYDIVSLGYFDKRKQIIEFKEKSAFYGRAMWNSGNHNTGLYITRSIWEYIKECSNDFCTYDDYNWDWTLQHIGQSCLKSTFYSIFPIASRVIHIGDCGTHYKSKNCDPKDRVNELNKIINEQSNYIFPKTFTLEINKKVLVKIKANGGWSDKRDHMLCKSFFSFTNFNINETIQII